MNKNIDARIQSLLDWLVSHPIPTTWRSSSVFPSAGERRSRSRGSDGYDFAARVLYEPGDDIRDIDWAATAATGGQEVYIIENYEPRDSRFFVLVDVGLTMGFGTNRTSKRMLAGELAGSVILSAKETADRVGFVAYTDDSVVDFQPPRGAQVALYPALAAVVEADERALDGTLSRSANADKSVTGFQMALDTVGGYTKSLVFIISDFLNLTEEDKAMLFKLAAYHDVVCINVQDLRERELPNSFGFYTFEDLKTGQRKTIWLNKKNREQFEANFRAHEQELFDLFRRCQCDWEVVSTEEGLAAHAKLMQLFAGHRT
ncbi:MAG: DUF58 domain-containing protein [Candidatus Melainabacteria bacterium]|nr:DUF58 domain-containing protein [Candidatus Melainabacteria bacterium]